VIPAFLDDFISSFFNSPDQAIGGCFTENSVGVPKNIAITILFVDDVLLYFRVEAKPTSLPGKVPFLF